MSNNHLPVKRDDGRLLRTIFMGSVGNWIYERCTKTDYDRQVEAVRTMKENGMEHGEVEMCSKHQGTIHIEEGDIFVLEENIGRYRW